ncbi:uncharacterized protein [Amphiura filiformis]|uniref:uncharacterized protein n=1 Tax=Amphiura filiformis TaxID=82378 RepID=UPI003B216118
MSVPSYLLAATSMLYLCSYVTITFACGPFSEFRRTPKHPQALYCEADFAFRGKVLRSYRADHYLRRTCREELNIRERRRSGLPPGIPDYIFETLSSASNNESQFEEEQQEEEDDFPQLPCPLTTESIAEYHRLWQLWSRSLKWNLEVEMSGDGRLPDQVSEIVYVPGPAVITTVYLVAVIKVFKGEQYVTERDIAQVFSWGLNLHSDFIYIMTGHVHKDSVVKDNDRSEEVRTSMLEGQLNIMGAHWVSLWSDITRHQEKGLLGFYRQNCQCSILQCQSGRSQRECAMEAIHQGFHEKDNYCSWKADDFMCLHYFSACVNSSSENGSSHKCVWNWHRDMRVCNRHLPTSIERNQTGRV